MKAGVIQVEERGFTERFYLRDNKGHLKGFQTNLKHFFMILPAESGPDGKIPPGPGTNQIAGFVEFRPLTH